MTGNGAITVCTSIAGYAPVIGQKLKFLFLGGHVVGESALIRFYVLHVIVLPVGAVLLIAVHLWRVRKDGGLARPDEPQAVQQDLPPAQLPVTKTYGLMELARGTTPAVGIKPEDEVFTWPNLVFREILLFMATVAFLLILSIFWNARQSRAPRRGHSSGRRGRRRVVMARRPRRTPRRPAPPRP